MGAKKQCEYQKLTSDELALLSQNGDDIAFNALARRFINTRYSRVNSTFLDTDDFIQEGMVGFLSAVRTFNPSKGVPFDAYASICMRNSISTAAVNVPEDIPVDTTSEGFAYLESPEDPLKRVLTNENLSEVLSACEVSLSKLEKSVVFFKASGMSYAEIADKLNMNPKTVDNAVQRARRKLKSVLADNG